MFESRKIKKAIKKLMAYQPAEISDAQIIEHLIDLKTAEEILPPEDLDGLMEAYEAYRDRSEKLLFESYEDFAARAAEIAYTLNDFADAVELLNQKDPELCGQVEAYLDDFRVYQKHIFTTYFNTVKSMVAICNRPETEKNDNYDEADMYAMSSVLFGMLIAAVENGYRDMDPNGYIEFRDMITREDMNDALFWRSYRAFEAKMSSLLKEKYPDYTEGSCVSKQEGMMKEYSIIMNSKVPTSTKLFKIGEAYYYNCGVKAPTEALLDVIENFIVYLKFYPMDELAIVDHDFKKMFGQFSHPITKQPIASAQDYLDAVSTQSTGMSVVTDRDLSLEEVDRKYAEAYGATVNPRTGKPISSAADFIDAYKCQRGLY